MFKTITTLLRGRNADAGEAFAQANALPLLRQQIRDSSLSVKKSRQAVAIAMAGQEQEISRYSKIKKQIADLETRALAAIEQNKQAIAEEAAEAIAGLEDEKTASEKAQSRYNAEITRLKSDIRNAQFKLRDLERGYRLATATNKTQMLAGETPLHTTNSLKDAEQTLAKLEHQQECVELTRRAEAELEQSTTPSDIASRMADQGLGKPMHSSADAVMERLKAKSTKK